MRLNLLEIGRILESVCVGLSAQLALTHPAGAAIDSREVRPGHLFFCLPGEKADGHDFAAQAVAAGAVAVVGTRDPFDGPHPVPVFVVADTVQALGRIASEHRRRSDAIVVGVTGTSGKTSVKEALATVLSEQGETCRNPVNLNNQIGLPLSLLNASPDAMYWVMEAGISRDGDMDELGGILRPDIALILNAGSGHVEGLGDKVAQHKARLLAWMPPDGRGAVSADYPDLVAEAEHSGRRISYFSALDPERDVFAAPLETGSEARGQFALRTRKRAVRVSAPFIGRYGAENVAAIGAVADILGLTDQELTTGLARAELPRQRFSMAETGRYLVIDDSYNANPLSMSRMLEAAGCMASAAKRDLVLVLGEMGELGPDSAGHHAELGRLAAALKPLAVFWKGGQAEAFRQGLQAAGFAGKFTPVEDASAFSAAFSRSDIPSGVVLVKGSRSNRMEDLVVALNSLADNQRPAGCRDAL